MFEEAFHSTIRGIHLTLEVKTSFSNSTPTTGFSTASPRLPLITVISIAEKKRRGGTCTQKVTKQSLSDYAQQD
jgi:hypothetical protein